ncbi:MAG: type II toxin-antitoxin system HicA family toxin [Candidatus Kapabacteria bacterium]|nr:type II toxin-antitoxin system HicA family toxin [Candidatus Kapabacteria bacterium]
MKRIDFERYLKRMGCIKIREGSNHSIWQNTKNDKQSSVPRHNEIVNITCKIICKQLEIKSPF